MTMADEGIETEGVETDGVVAAPARPPHETAGVWIGVLMLLLAVPVTAWGYLNEPDRMAFWLFVPPLVASLAAAVPTFLVSRAANPGWVPGWGLPVSLVVLPLAGIPSYLLYFLPVFGAWALLGISEGLGLSVFRDYAGIWWLFLVAIAVLVVLPGCRPLAARIVSWALPGFVEEETSAVGSYLAVMMPWIVPPAFLLRSTRAWARRHWKQALGSLAVLMAVAVGSGRGENLAIEISLSPAVFAAAVVSVIPLSASLSFILGENVSFKIRALWLLALLEMPIALYPFSIDIEESSFIYSALTDSDELIKNQKHEEAARLLAEAFEKSVRRGMPDEAAEAAVRWVPILLARGEAERAASVAQAAVAGLGDVPFGWYLSPCIGDTCSGEDPIPRERARVLDLMIWESQALIATGQKAKAVHIGLDAWKKAVEAQMWPHLSVLARTFAGFYQSEGMNMDAYWWLADARNRTARANGPPEELDRLEAAIADLRRAIGDEAFEAAVEECARKDPTWCGSGAK